MKHRFNCSTFIACRTWQREAAASTEAGDAATGARSTAAAQPKELLVEPHARAKRSGMPSVIGSDSYSNCDQYEANALT